MVGLIEILLPEFGNGGRHVHRSAGQAPRLNAALIRCPLRYINGANTYQFVGSSPVGLVDATGTASWVGGGWVPMTDTGGNTFGGARACG